MNSSIVGYQIIEPQVLSGLFGLQHNFTIAIIVFNWLIAELRKQLGAKLDGVELKVIVVQYHGSYPALGIRYGEYGSDLAPMLEKAIEQLLLSRPARSLVEFIVSSGVDWNQAAAQLMAESSVSRPPKATER